MTFDPPVLHVIVIVIIVIVRPAAFQGGFAKAISTVFFYRSTETLKYNAAFVVPSAEERIAHRPVLYEIA